MVRFDHYKYAGVNEVAHAHNNARTVEWMGPVIVLGNNLSARTSSSGITKTYTTAGEVCYGSEYTVCHNKVSKYIGRPKYLLSTGYHP